MIEHEEQTLEQETVRLYDDMRARSLIPLWRIEEATLSPQPRPTTLAWLWKWAELYDVAQRAGRLVPVERGGDRRWLLQIRRPDAASPVRELYRRGAQERCD
jgi:gentisate 1,2-dioxygenase